MYYERKKEKASEHKVGEGSGTFGAGEEQVVGAVYTQHCFGMALRHVDTLQRGPAAALGGRERVDDTSGERRGKGTHTHKPK